MLRFLTTGGASFAYDADFTQDTYANLSFFAANKRDILFHLSLRPQKGLAVTNLRRQGEWAGEQRVETAFETGVNRVGIRFDEDGIAVDLNGKELLRTAPGDYPDTAEARFVNWGGAILDDTVEIGGPANEAREGQGALALETPFGLTGWAFDPGRPVQSPAIEVDGLDEPLRCHVSAAPTRARDLGAATDMLAIRASLPGRVWRLADAEGRVTIRAVSNRIPCGEPLLLGRDDVTRMVEEIATRQSPEADSFAALSVIEHVGFAGLYDGLSAAAQRYVLAAARLYNVTGWLFPDGAPEEAAQDADQQPPVSPGDLLARRIRQALNERLADTPEAGIAATLAELLETWPLDDAARKALVLSLIEPACQSGRAAEVSGLNRLIADQPLDHGTDSWQRALRLPLVLLREGLEPAARAVQALADMKGAWVCPSALGWVFGHIATQETNPWEDRHTDAALRGLMTVTERLARGYWRQPCTALIAGVVTLLANRDRLPDATARLVRDFALRAFGGSQDFWARVDAAAADGTLRPGGRVDAAREAFAVIADETAKPAALDAALRHMQAIGVLEAPRLRLELLGPGGTAGDSGIAADLAQTASGLDAGDLALRSLAFPGSTLDNPRLAETARQTLAARWNNVDKAAYYTAQKQAAMAIAALLGELHRDGAAAASDARIDALMPGLRKLSGQMNGFVGLAMMLVLIGALDRAGAQAQAERLMAQLGRIKAAMPPAMAGGIAAAPAVRSALSRLARDAAARRSVVLDAALALFPERPDMAALYPETTVAVSGDDTASALFDTLVTVFSCKPYLETRVKAMRDGWLRDLKALGVPYVIVVGDGDGRLEGDVVHLEAPDDYEGLPQKTLATAKWVFENTRFDHMLKIDDDCFLNVGEYFGSLSYRKFDYYGRGLTRTLGAMNRTWHHEKSQSDRARSELDKSPEPASYADGGGGYALSRHAMRALLDAAATPEGWRLIDNSYMEDKMVGDLLAMRGISVSTEDYYTTIWRRTHGPARQIMLWDNYFLPSAASPCKMAHLDTATEQGPTHGIATANTLLPRKIWPTSQHAILGYNSNQLELLSEEKALFRLNKADLAVICACRNERARLPRYLAHYRKLGVTAFLFVDNASDDGSREYLLEQPDCAVFSADTTYAAGRFGLTWQVALMAQLRLGRWSLIADADELLVYKGWEKGGLPKFVSAQAKTGAKTGVDAFRMAMIDMYPKGALADLGPEDDPFTVAGFTDRAPVRRDPLYRGVFSNDATRVSAVRHRLLPEARDLTFVAQKYALLRYRPWMRLSEGLHYAAQVKAGPEVFGLAHFKYDAGFAARVAEEVTRGQHFNRAEEYRHYARLLGEDGALSFWDDAVSVPWTESETAQAILS